ncbi:MAG TPA: O-acetyl-ADP-ribose deacetylase [Vicinamibacteria bacterium]|jgi:O-acetyl-ADP-ribose deacetylase (regulator of RNase III)|nr:O-acetyl-ADP-ribose deacetylase [Vicinamibacteria bacterium]
MTTRIFGRTRVELVRGDITRESVDAIVNAANSSLMGGGGVDGAIHRTGGPAILEDCRRIRKEKGPLPPGQAVVTGAGHLPCRHVIHTVGPVWAGGGAGEPETLARCYRNCLALAPSHGFTSLAFPSISTGAFGYPVEAAAAVALRAAREVLMAGSPLEVVRFVLFSDADLVAYRAALEAL